VSGSLDDHALPVRSKLGLGSGLGLGLGIGGRDRTHGLGLPLPHPSPAASGLGKLGRRSMPPPAKGEMGPGSGVYGGYGNIGIGSSPSSVHLSGTGKDEEEGGVHGLRRRKSSFKKVLRSSKELAGLAGEKWANVVQGVQGRSGTTSASATTPNGSPYLDGSAMLSNLDIPRTGRPAPVHRDSSGSSTRSPGIVREETRSSFSASHGNASVANGYSDGRRTPTSALGVGQNVVDVSASPASRISSWSDRTRMSWYDETQMDGEIEKRVLEMAGIGGTGTGSAGSVQQRRVVSERIREGSELEVNGMTEVARTKSADVPRERVVQDGGRTESEGMHSRGAGKGEMADMRMLRRLADIEGNKKCADCGKGMKSSRWATLSE
jgi:hypothetical protein